ncbi:peptidylprolyl isomerase [Arcobacter vandammei]|uniref:peptidylprolyl isomerase n=1 Tax=Arcobacter vandammei TaxID=2782243 RepID=UPI0018DF8FFC|nr:peptidylprolyl isomerase [Arcobacter vandammei]
MRKILFIFLSFALFVFANENIEKNPIALFDTNMGSFKIELKPKMAPKAVENFIALSKKGYYNGLIFHRVIKNFMIQGGDPTGTGAGGESIWGTTFEDEFSPNAVFDKPFILAMANKGKNTNGSQFFITTAPTYWLNGMHTIFGYVIEGTNIVKDIENVQTAGRYGADKPLNDIVINKITIEE